MPERVPNDFDDQWFESPCPRCHRLLNVGFTDREMVVRIICARGRCEWRGLVRGPDAPSAAELIAVDGWWGDGFLGDGQEREVAESRVETSDADQ